MKPRAAKPAQRAAWPPWQLPAGRLGRGQGPCGLEAGPGGWHTKQTWPEAAAWMRQRSSPEGPKPRSGFGEPPKAASRTRPRRGDARTPLCRCSGMPPYRQTKRGDGVEGAPFRLRQAWPVEHGTAGAAVTSRRMPGSDGGGARTHRRKPKGQPRPRSTTGHLLGATVRNE